MDSFDNTLRERILRSSNNEQFFAAKNGIRLTKLEQHYAEGEMLIEGTLNPRGIVHGGALMTLADQVAGVAVTANGRFCTTVSCNMNFLRPAKGTRVKCVAEAEKVGKTLTIMRALLTDDDGNLVATATLTFYVLDPLPGLK